METAMEDVHTSTGDPQPSQSDDEGVGGFPTQMGSGRRDARVVCETFTSGRDFRSGTGSFSRHMSHNTTETQKNLKHFKRRGFAHSHSRNPLLACFIGESVLSSRAIRLSPNCDSASSQRAFFSLIPVDNSRVNEGTGEPSSPQLSCIGQVKCRQAKAPRGTTSKADHSTTVVVEDFAQMDLGGESKDGVGRLGTRRSGREKSLERTAVDDIPPLDLNEGIENPRLMRSCKRLDGFDHEGLKKIVEIEKELIPVSTYSTVSKHSIQHFNHLLKQLLGASMFRTGFICGWSSRESVHEGEDGRVPGDAEIAADHYEIDLSRFASCDMQAKTPSFRDSRYYQTSMGKKLPDIRVHSHHQVSHAISNVTESEVSREGNFSLESTRDESTFATQCSIDRRKAAPEATLWKRRCMDRPLSLEVKR